MRKVLFVLLLALAIPATAHARPVREPSQWGIGFALGRPTGLTLKHYMGGSDAFDIVVGGGPGLRIHGDYLFGLAQLASSRDMNLDLYLGPGVILGLDRDRWCGGWRGRDFCHDDDPYLGVRAAFGLDFVFRRAPVSFGFEVAPAVLIDTHDADGTFDLFAFVRFLL